MSKLLQKFKDLYSRVRITATSYKVSSINPKHDWKVLLTSAFIILLILASVAFYFYIQVDSGKFFVVSGSKADREVKIDEKLLKKAVEDVNLRESALILIKQNRVAPPDPSL